MRYKEIITETTVRVGKNAISIPWGQYPGGIDAYVQNKQIHSQANNLIALRKILSRHGMDFNWFATRGSKNTFCAVVGDPSNAKFIWYREGVQMGEINNVFMHDWKIKTMEFLNFTPEKQDEMIKGTFKKTKDTTIPKGSYVKIDRRTMPNQTWRYTTFVQDDIIFKVRSVRTTLKGTSLSCRLVGPAGEEVGDAIPFMADLVNPASDAEVAQWVGQMKNRTYGNVIKDKTIFVMHSHLVSLEGSPDHAEALNAQNNYLTDLKGAPSRIDGAFNVAENRITSLEGAPKYIGGDVVIENNNLTNLKDIHKHLPEINGYINFEKNPIRSHVLGLLLIKGLKRVVMDNKVVATILNKHLGKGRAGLVSCQTELIEAGFSDFAKL